VLLAHLKTRITKLRLGTSVVYHISFVHLCCTMWYSYIWNANYLQS